MTIWKTNQYAFLITLKRFNLLLLSILTHLPLSATSVNAEIELGVITELSGSFIANGEDCRLGHETAMNAYTENGAINGQKIKLVYGDSRGEGKTAINELRKLISANNLNAILVNRSQVAMAISPILLAKRLPMVAVAAHPDLIRLNSFAFRIFPSSRAEAEAISRELARRQLKSIAMVSLEDEYLIALRDSIRQMLPKRQILLDETVLEGEMDYVSLASRILILKPQVVFVNLGINQSGLLIRRLREQSTSLAIFSNFWVQKKEVIGAAGKANTENVFFVGLSNDLPQFERELKRLNPALLPTANYYACHAALGVVLQTIRRNPGIQSAQDMHKALLETKSVSLLDEKLEMREREALFRLSTYEIKNGIPVRRDQ